MDPELTDAAPEITAALIDGRDTPDPVFEAGARLDDARVKARDLLFCRRNASRVNVTVASVVRVGPVRSRSSCSSIAVPAAWPPCPPFWPSRSSNANVTSSMP